MPRLQVCRRAAGSWASCRSDISSMVLVISACVTARSNCAWSLRSRILWRTGAFVEHTQFRPKLSWMFGPITRSAPTDARRHQPRDSGHGECANRIASLSDSGLADDALAAVQGPLLFPKWNTQRSQVTVQKQVMKRVLARDRNRCRHRCPCASLHAFRCCSGLPLASLVSACRRST